MGLHRRQDRSEMGEQMIDLHRHPDWQLRLHRYLSTLWRQPLRYGAHDCCLFGAGAIAAQTGVDLAAPFRGRYRSLQGGLRLLRRSGFVDHVALIAVHLPEATPGAARPGDIAVVPTEDGPEVGVVQGAAVYALHPTGGIGLVPIAPVQRLFKVG